MVDLYCGDCLELMKDIPSGSVDMILCDLPYGITHNKWDSVIPLTEIWDEYTRIIKQNGAICLFADGLFMARLMLFKQKLWRYNLVWDKVLPSGFLNANKMPLRRTEEVCVFYQKAPTYNPQKTIGSKNHSKGKSLKSTNNNYGEFRVVDNREQLGNLKHPTSLITIQKPHPSVAVHPTEKPVAICEWLIRTYTNPGEIVLDNCMGSGSTGVACVKTGRRFIGMELDKGYFDIAKTRITAEQKAVNENELLLQ